KNQFLQLINLIADNSVHLSFYLALVAALGSLYFSNVMQLPPCDLCWYQRIFAYPLLIITGVALLIKDTKYTYVYNLAFSAIALVIALYHNLLQQVIIKEDLISCGGGSSCSDISLQLAGFITIPLMSLGFFSAMLIINGAKAYQQHRVV